MSLPLNPKIQDLSEATLIALRTAAIAHGDVKAADSMDRAISVELKRRSARPSDRQRR